MARDWSKVKVSLSHWARIYRASEEQEADALAHAWMTRHHRQGMCDRWVAKLALLHVLAGKPVQGDHRKNQPVGAHRHWRTNMLYPLGRSREKDPARLAAVRELMDRLLRNCSRLERCVLQMRRDGWEWRDIARRLGSSIDCAWKAFHRARRRARKAMPGAIDT